MYDVFISYARGDRERAEAFQRAISNAGWTVWWDAHLLPGQQWNDEIERELRAAGVVVVLWSKQSVNSQFVCDEATIAREMGKLVPVTLDGTRPKVGMGQLQLENMSEWDGKASDHPGLIKVLAGIRHMVKPRGPVIADPPRGHTSGESARPTGSSGSKVPLIAAAAVVGLIGVGGFVALPYLRDTPATKTGETTPSSSEKSASGTPASGTPANGTPTNGTPAGDTSKARPSNPSTATNRPPVTKPLAPAPPPAVTPTPAGATTAAATAAAPGPSAAGCAPLITATRKDPDNAEGFFDLGKCHFNENRFNDSVTAYSAAIDINANVARYFEGRGLAKWKNNSADRGISDLTAAIQLSPKDGSLYESRGQVHLANRKWQLAFDDFDKATNINAKSKRAWLGLAEAAQQNGSPEIAESAKATASALP